MEIKRQCATCGKKLSIKINKDKSYIGGHYFGKIKSKGKQIGYWECDKS